MSFDISKTRFIMIDSMPVIRAKVKYTIFADLYTNRSTGRLKTDPETGDVIIDKDGKPVVERKENTWEGRFVGKACEAAKELKEGDVINIIRGKLDKDVVDYDDPNQAGATKTVELLYAVIYDFEMANVSISEMTIEDLGDYPGTPGAKWSDTVWKA